MKKIKSTLFFVAYLCSLVPGFTQQLAFPTAEGHGKYAIGGRGGAVVEVTNLNDSGPGSFREAVENKIGPRTIVFRVGGIIDLKSQITLEDSYVTIAGQTAPGDGICIKNYPLMIKNSEHIIVRYLRSRLGDQGKSDDDALSVRNSRHVILDHCSLSWSIDAILDVTHNSGNLTVQYCILSEALSNSHHEKGAHGYAAGWDGQGGSTYHHNLIANCVSRTPRLDSYAHDGVRDLIEIINNVIYNWSSYGAYGGENSDVNWVNNFYRFGPETPADRRNWIFGSGAENKMYLSGNFVYGDPATTEDNSLGINYDGKTLDEIRADVLVDEPFDTEGIEMETAKEAYKTVLSNAGALLPKRDEVDARIIEDVINGTGSFIDSQDEVGGWPDYASGEAPVDSDGDGMPDVWEDENGLDKNDPSDRNDDRNGDGYTNLEEYLYSLVVFADPGAITLPPVPVSSIEIIIENGSDTLDIADGPVQLTANVLPQDAGNKEIEWAVNGEGVIKVDSNGLLTPIGPGKAVVRAMSTDGSGKIGFQIIVVTGVVLSSDVKEDRIIMAYPNPSSKNIIINAPGRLNKIQLLDVKGVRLLEYFDREINLENLKSGVYFLKVWVENRSEVIRIVKY